MRRVGGLRIQLRASFLFVLFFSFIIVGDGIFQPASAGCSERVSDGSFETGTPNSYWNEYSLAFGTPLCSLETCGYYVVRTGDWAAWFGGVDGYEAGSLTQTVTIPPGSTTTLEFYLVIAPGEGTGFLQVRLGSTVLFSVSEGTQGYTDAYTLVSIDLSSYADGLPRPLCFESETYNTANFFVDDVSVLACGAAPSVTTELASSVSATGATLNGVVNPMGRTTTAFFEFGTTAEYGESVDVSQGVLDGDTDIAVTASLTGLIPDTIYHFRVKAISEAGEVYGEDSIFNTTSCGGPVRLGLTDYNSIDAAYLAVAADDSKIALLTGGYTGDLLLDGNFSIILEGGNDCSFGTPSGHSIIYGSITLESKPVTMDRIIISTSLTPP
jgi:hypothetical protein